MCAYGSNAKYPSRIYFHGAAVIEPFSSVLSTQSTKQALVTFNHSHTHSYSECQAKCHPAPLVRYSASYLKRPMIFLHSAIRSTANTWMEWALPMEGPLERND